jgi:asparagine synthase (glutamine-hydrolysing)
MGFNASINSLIDLNSKKFLSFVNKKSSIYKIINKKNLMKNLINKNNENHFSKFIFSFISVKIFLELNN